MKKLLSIIFALSATVCATAQTAEYDSLRHHTWSIYGQGGVSFATGGDLMENIDEAPGTVVAPMVGGGISYTFNPWIRLSANYTFSKYKREQRFSALQDNGLAYRRFSSMYHAVDGTLEFNFMELWRNRHNKRFNIWLGTGFGVMFTKGPLYSITMGEEHPGFTERNSSSNDNYEIHSWLKADNERFSGNSMYIPAVLNIEYDLVPQVSLGLRGQANFLLKTRDFLPAMTEAVGVSLRYNFVRTHWRTKVKRLEELEPMYADLQDRYAASLRTIGDLRNQLKDCNDRADDLQNALEECQGARRGLLNIIGNRTVYFENNKWDLSPAANREIDEIADLAKADPSIVFTLVGSANATGTEAHNMELSENRTKAVAEALQTRGVSAKQIEDQRWVGQEGMTADPKCRRVVIELK